MGGCYQFQREHPAAVWWISFTRWNVQPRCVQRLSADGSARLGRRLWRLCRSVFSSSADVCVTTPTLKWLNSWEDYVKRVASNGQIVWLTERNGLWLQTCVIVDWLSNSSLRTCRIWCLPAPLASNIEQVVTTQPTTLSGLTVSNQWRRHTRWVGCVHTPSQENT